MVIKVVSLLLLFSCASTIRVPISLRNFNEHQNIFQNFRSPGFPAHPDQFQPVHQVQDPFHQIPSARLSLQKQPITTSNSRSLPVEHRVNLVQRINQQATPVPRFHAQQLRAGIHPQLRIQHTEASLPIQHLNLLAQQIPPKPYTPAAGSIGVPQTYNTISKPASFVSSQYAAKPHSSHHEAAYVVPVYTFSYGVEDIHTGDFHSQKESREGDHTQGEYSLREPDGSIRTVKYTVKGDSGFNAVVERSGQTKSYPVLH